MKNFRCLDCLTEFEADELPRRGSICFKCHIRSINLGFTYGKDDFHGPTIGERAREQERQAAEAGIKAEPVGSRWI
jgi:hypothetical protein